MCRLAFTNAFPSRCAHLQVVRYGTCIGVFELQTLTVRVQEMRNCSYQAGSNSDVSPCRACRGRDHHWFCDLKVKKVSLFFFLSLSLSHIHSLIHSLTRSLTHSFTHSLVHSLMLSLSLSPLRSVWEILLNVRVRDQEPASGDALTLP